MQGYKKPVALHSHSIEAASWKGMDKGIVRLIREIDERTEKPHLQSESSDSDKPAVLHEPDVEPGIMPELGMK